MKKEHIKSAILIFLIGMSVILSWNLYTYQPDIALIDVSSRYVSNELIGEERSLNEIVRPDQAVVYADDELALIPRYHNDFETLISMMLQANYDEDPVFVTEPYPLVTDRGGIELVFPTLIQLRCSFRFWQSTRSTSQWLMIWTVCFFIFTKPMIRCICNIIQARSVELAR